MASKTVGTSEVYTELSQRVINSNSNVRLDELGFTGKDAALLLDLIVYLALENVAFYRALDLTTCDSLLSWLDFEYLNVDGNLQDRYRDGVVSGCNQLSALLKAWTSGLDRVLGLYPTRKLLL